jgi:DNA polymerase-3 subunit alpha
VTYDLVQSYGSTRTRVAGIELTYPALVEDSHGHRLLLIGPDVPEPVWEQAARAGAQGLLRISGGPVMFAPADWFTQYRRANRFAAVWELDERHWVTVSDWLGLLDLLDLWKARHRGGNPFVHLHTHSEHSPLDGLSTMDEIGLAVTADGQVAVGVTDHGTCAGHPALQQMATETGLRPVFGIEAYFTDDRHAREDPHDYRHLCLYAKDDAGLRNLWALSTESFRDGFYRYPRIDWDTLARLGTGLICSTACLRGPLAEPFKRGDEERALANLARLGDLFGDDLYIELHTNALAEQHTVNQWLVGTARTYQVPLIAAVDSHYANASQAEAHRVWLAMTTNSDVDDPGLFEGGGSYHLLTAAEVSIALSYLGDEGLVEEAIAATGKLAAGCTAEIHPQQIKPVYSRPTAEHPDPAVHDAERFVDQALANWDERITRRGLDPAPYWTRFEYEGQLLIEKGYPGYYLICADYVSWAKEHAILVGPGRGSGAASLFAYLHKITEIDPVEGELNLDRFMTPGRQSLPDFDIDFPSSKADQVIGYVQQRWGHEHVARVGSHIRLQNKGAFRDVQRALSSRLPPESFGWINLISKVIDAAEASTAGLGLSWEELMTQAGHLLFPFKDKMPELFDYAEAFRGRLRTYGKHSAGFIIDPDSDLEADLPMRSTGDGGPMVTQFDMDALEYLGKVKFDLLMIRNLDTVQDTIDAIRTDTGHVINPYVWHEEYTDPQVYEDLGNGWTMGVFQLETNLGTRTTKAIRPQTRSQLADVTTIGRPGPLRSGLDKLYLRRRNGEEPVDYPDPRLEAVLAKTYGVMLYQEDIMAICTVLAGYDADEADHVRKILGKKKVELVESEGRKFIERAVAHDTDRGTATHIWGQMAEFARYSFNRAHAYSYATFSFWEAWLKTHYPRQFLTAVMATVDKDRISAFVAEAHRLGYTVLPPDINASGRGFAAHDLEVRYGLASVPGIGNAVADAIIEAQPYTDYDDFLARKGPACNMGHIRKLVAVGAFDSIYPHRRALEARLADDLSGASEVCAHHSDTLNEFALPCQFNWASEPVKLGRTGKPLKTQLRPPKRCTKGCRHYTLPEAKDYDHLPRYTEEQIRDREVEMLGIYLSSSPFDVVPYSGLSLGYTADDLTVTDLGSYQVFGVITSVRPDHRGRGFGFANFQTQSGELSTIIFRNLWGQLNSRRKLRPGTLVLLSVDKTDDDRFRLRSLDVLDPAWLRTVKQQEEADG